MFISSYTLCYINKPHFIFKGENWAYIEFHEQCEDSSGIASRLVYIRKRFWLIGQWAKVIFTSSALHNIFLKVLHSPLRELMNIDDLFSTNFRRYSRPCFYTLYKVMNNKNDIHLSVSCAAYKLNLEQQRSWRRKKNKFPNTFQRDFLHRYDLTFISQNPISKYYSRPTQSRIDPFKDLKTYVKSRDFTNVTYLFLH